MNGWLSKIRSVLGRLSLKRNEIFYPYRYMKMFIISFFAPTTDIHDTKFQHHIFIRPRVIANLRILIYWTATAD